MSKRSPGTTNRLDRACVSREMLLVSAAAREQLAAAVELLDRASGNLQRLALGGPASTHTEEALVAARRALALVEITLKRIP